MKLRFFHGSSFAFAFVITSALCLGPRPTVSVAQTTQTYDNASLADVWDTTTPNWDNNTTVWVNGNNAAFGGTGETVDVIGDIVVNNITFTANGYVIRDDATTPPGTLTLGATSTISLSASAAGSTTISEVLGGGAVGGTISVTKAVVTGTATLILAAQNTFLGNFTITSPASSGTINVDQGVANSLPATTVVSLVGATGGTLQFRLFGFDATVAGLTETASGTRRITNGSATPATLTINQTDPSVVRGYGSQVGSMGTNSSNANNFSVVKTGAGAQNLSNNNPQVAGTNAAGVGYFGNTTISDGALGFNAILGAIGPTSSLVILDGGVISSNGGTAGSFTRTFGSTPGAYLGTNTEFQMTANGGGFSARGNVFTVNIGGAAAPVDFANVPGNNFVGTLKFGHVQSTNEVLFLNPINLNGADRTIQVDDNAANIQDFTTLAGALSDGSGPAGLIKTGAGRLVLGAANTYSGNTTVSAGTLLVTGSLSASTSPVTVAPAATLGGTGQIDRPVTVNGTLSPGTSAGTLNVGNTLSFGAGSSLVIEIGGATPGDVPGSYDQVNMTNAAAAISLDGTATITLSLTDGFAPVEGDVFYVLTRADAGSFGGAFANAPEDGFIDLGNGTLANITYQANWTGTQAGSTFTGGNDMAFVVVPEPGAVSLLAASVSLLAVGRRRRSYLPS